MSVLLIRHTRLSGTDGVCYGRHDLPLAQSFESDVAGVLAKLRWPPEIVWTSPAQRCRALAERLTTPDRLRLDSRLRELSFGQWEGQRWNDLSGPAVDAWMKNPWEARPPGGETVPELVERVGAFRAEALKRNERQVVVTHAGVIRVWRSLAERRSLPEVFAEPVGFGEFVEGG